MNASDAVIKASENINKELDSHFTEMSKPTLDYQSPEDYVEAYSDFYDEILASEEVLQD